jgi:hypothetical protein
MRLNELKRAMQLAEDYENVDLSKEDIEVFVGFGLSDFKPVYVTIRQVARLIRWQAQLWNGEWDSEALQEIANYGRKRFKIIG